VIETLSSLEATIVERTQLQSREDPSKSRREMNDCSINVSFVIPKTNQKNSPRFSENSRLPSAARFQTTLDFILKFSLSLESSLTMSIDACFLLQVNPLESRGSLNSRSSPSLANRRIVTSLLGIDVALFFCLAVPLYRSLSFLSKSRRSPSRSLVSSSQLFIMVKPSRVLLALLCSRVPFAAISALLRPPSGLP